jgi:hypothetical protein
MKAITTVPVFMIQLSHTLIIAHNEVKCSKVSDWYHPIVHLSGSNKRKSPAFLSSLARFHNLGRSYMQYVLPEKAKYLNKSHWRNTLTPIHTLMSMRVLNLRNWRRRMRTSLGCGCVFWEGGFVGFCCG